MRRRHRHLLPVIAVALLGVGAPCAASPLQAQPAGAFVPKKPFAAFSASAERLRDSVVAMARGTVGTRYRFGGTRPGVGLDCSGLVRYALSILDVMLPRTAQGQATAGTEVPRALEALEPGDVLTFGRGARISHVGIYVGNGRMVHASTSQRRVIETDLAAPSTLLRQWKGVRRFVGGAADRLRDSVLAAADTLY